MMKRTVCLILIILGMASAAFAAQQDLKNPTPNMFPALISPQFSDMLNAVCVPIKPSTGTPEMNLLLAQTESDELSHTALSSALQQKDNSYYLKAGAAMPIYDKKFRDFIDYGADVTLGVAKKLTDKLTITASIGVVMMTGKWSIKGDRQSITIAAEEWPAGINTDPYDYITPEDIDESDYGTSYIGGGEAVITSSENLKSVDVDTTLYLFPITLGALYRFHEGGKVNPYVGGGIGICMAERSVDSKALKEKYFEGPQYGIKLNDSQTVTGMLLQFVAGFDVPLRKNLTLVAEASTTLYDLESFDPILEVSYQKQSPTPFDGYSDITTYSYEEPLKIGVFQEEFVTNISIGLVMPF